MTEASDEDRPPHPKVRVSAAVGWYLRATAVAGGLLIVLLLGQRGLVFVPLLLVGYLLLARRSTRGWGVMLGMVAAYMTAELLWFVVGSVLGIGGVAVAFAALGVGVAVGVLIARAAPIGGPPDRGEPRTDAGTGA